MYYGDDGSSDGDGVDDKTMMVVLIKNDGVWKYKNYESSNWWMDGWM